MEQRCWAAIKRFALWSSLASARTSAGQSAAELAERRAPGSVPRDGENIGLFLYCWRRQVFGSHAEVACEASSALM